MPEIRPFRALRYDRSTIEDESLVLAPPYDVIDPAEHERLLARHPANVVRLELPRGEPGDEPDDRYRRAARTLAAWRSDGTLHKDPHPSIYVYEQAYLVPGTEVPRVQRGYFARLRLETFGPDAGVLPHERTMAGPREDRYKLLRATGVNTSPVVALYDDRGGVGRPILDELTRRPADLDVFDEDDVRHRLWAVPADGDAAAIVAPLLAVAAAGPVTIADGHHRYETALRYRDERRMSRSCEEDPAFDYLLTLLIDAVAEPLTVLPTHRLLRNLGDEGVARLLDGLEALFEVRRDVARDDLRGRFEAIATEPGGAGRFGLWTRSGGAILVARRHAFAPWLPAGGDAAPRARCHAARGRPGAAGRDRRRGPRGRRRRVHQVGRRSARRRGCRTRRHGRGVPPGADARRVDPRRRRGRRRHAPEVDLFLPQGPDRPGHQPARMVNLHARHNA